MSDFLTLCQEMRSAAGVSGTGPTTVVAQTGIHGRIVTAILDAWLRIQTHPKDWKWMWSDSYDLNVIINTTDFTLTNVGDIHTKTFVIYKVSLGASDISKVTYIDWDSFKSKFGALQETPTERPTVVTRLPNGNLRFYPIPDVAYTCDFEYQVSPQILASNTETPNLPERFHPLIKWEALKEFGGLEDAPEVLETAEDQSAVLWNELFWDQELRRKRFMTVIAE